MPAAPDWFSTTTAVWPGICASQKRAKWRAKVSVGPTADWLTTMRTVLPAKEGSAACAPEAASATETSESVRVRIFMSPSLAHFDDFQELRPIAAELAGADAGN